jgi:hypothetical protein
VKSVQGAGFITRVLLNKDAGRFRIGFMVKFARARARPVLAVCLVMAVSGAFLFNATEDVRSLEFEAAGGGTLTTAVTSVDCLAVVPKIGRSSAKNMFSPLRIGHPRLFVLPATTNILTTRSKSHIAGKINSSPDNIKDTILVKLRI